MSDRFTEATSQNYVQRLGSSIMAAVFGLLLFVVAILVLVWNESRSVDALRGLGQAVRLVTEASPTTIDAAQNGKLVHLTGALATKTPLSDPVMGLTKDGLIHLKRTVEMYQWKETEQFSSSSSVGGSETTQKTYTYTKTWSGTRIESSRFKLPSRHENPAMPITSEVVTARDATFGARTLAPALLDELDTYEAIPPPAGAPDGYQKQGDGLYKGHDPAMPQIGDIRVGFSGVPVQPISVMAAQSGATLTPFQTTGGYEVGLVSAGDLSAEDMVAEKRAEEKTLTWILRAAGFALFFVSLLLIASPLSALGNLVPFVASVIGGSMFVFAFGLAIPLTLVTIAVSWLVVRPLFGIGLLLVSAVCVLGYRRLRPSRRLVTPAAPGLQGGAPA